MKFQRSLLLLTALGTMAAASSSSTSSASSSFSSTASSFQKSQAFFNAMKQAPPLTSSTTSKSNQLRRQKSMQKLKRSLLQAAKPRNPLENNNVNANANIINANVNRALYYDDANGDDEYGDYGFDISSYSLKYATCSSVATFSDDLADDEDSTTVFYTQQFVVFRLCPTDYCVNGNGNGGSNSGGSGSDSDSDSDISGDDAEYYGGEEEEEEESSQNQSNMEKHGCMYDYGEYMIPLDDWLDIIGQYREEEFERYCDYCQACVGGYYNMNNDDGDGDGNGNGNDDGNNNNNNNNNNNKNNAYYGYGENRGDNYYNMGDLDDQYYENRREENDAADDAVNGDDAARRLGGDDAVNADDANNNNEGDNENKNYDCSYSDRCSGYGDVCYDENRVDWTKFFGCHGLAVDDETVLYVGPHCSKDKSTIVLAAFEDENCQSYAGDKYDLATMTDDVVTSGALEEYYRSDCISCKESNLPFQAEDDAEDNDNISEICENLYDYAAKCNRHIYSANDNSYQSYQQAGNEYAVCSFIASVVTGTYDEYGYIYINSKEYSSDNKYNAYSQSAIRKDVVTIGQAFGLTFFSLVLAGLSIYAAITKKIVERKLGFGASTHEPLSVAGVGAGVGAAKDVKRQDSGIMVCRSKSNISYQAPSNDSKLV